jgi:hypothetical protein
MEKFPDFLSLQMIYIFCNSLSANYLRSNYPQFSGSTGDSHQHFLAEGNFPGEIRGSKRKTLSCFKKKDFMITIRKKSCSV